MKVNNCMIKEQLDLINDMIIYYGIHHYLPHALLDTLYEIYITDYMQFTKYDINYMFTLIDKLSDKYDDKTYVR